MTEPHAVCAIFSLPTGVTATNELSVAYHGISTADASVRELPSGWPYKHTDSVAPTHCPKLVRCGSLSNVAYTSPCATCNDTPSYHGDCCVDCHWKHAVTNTNEAVERCFIVLNQSWVVLDAPRYAVVLTGAMVAAALVGIRKIADGVATDAAVRLVESMLATHSTWEAALAAIIAAVVQPNQPTLLTLVGPARSPLVGTVPELDICRKLDAVVTSAAGGRPHYGVFCGASVIRKGTVIWTEYEGETFTQKQVGAMTPADVRDRSTDWMEVPDGSLVYSGDIKHRKGRPPVGLMNTPTVYQDANVRGKNGTFVASRDIPAHTALLIDYGPHFPADGMLVRHAKVRVGGSSDVCTLHKTPSRYTDTEVCVRYPNGSIRRVPLPTVRFVRKVPRTPAPESRLARKSQRRTKRPHDADSNGGERAQIARLEATLAATQTDLRFVRLEAAAAAAQAALRIARLTAIVQRGDE
jgi:hypothetical protein